jgi:ribonuclease HII
MKRPAKDVVTAPLTHENELYEQGHEFICGIDEVGRGCIAGPVVACAVIMPNGLTIPGVNDSKQLTPDKRRELAATIKANAVAYALGWVSAAEIDRIGIRKATFEAMRAAYVDLSRGADALLIDGLGKVEDLGLCHAPPCRFVVRGDSASHTIAAASIIAKVERDAYMIDRHDLYPAYGFNQHKGYGTKPHTAAILEYGACDLHRKTFLKKLEGLK